MGNFWHLLPRPFTVLAPMEDVTDTVFRRIVSQSGRPDVFFTEFVNVDGMCSPGRDAVIHRLTFSKEERPLVAQIWGLAPDHYACAARDIKSMGFDGIDINMGCPVKKIVKTGACSALIKNPSLAREIVIATKEGAGSLPVSIKTRIGFSEKKTVEWSSFLLDLRPDALTMHGRIAKHMSDVPADWAEIGKVVQIRNAMKSDALIIGNGDVDSYETALRHHGRYGVDGIMIGRGVFHNIFVFQKDRNGRHYSDISTQSKIAYLRQHLQLQQHTWGNVHNFNVMKKFVKIYISSFGGASHLRSVLMAASNYSEMYSILNSWPSQSETTPHSVNE